MDYRLNTLATLIVLVLAIAIGIVSAIFLKDGVRRTVWAWTITIVFVVAACSSVIFEHSWMFSPFDQMAAQVLALGAAMVAITFAIRAA